MRVSRSLGRFQGTEAQFRSWLFSIARSTSVDFYRRAGRRRERLSEHLESADVATSHGPEQVIMTVMGTEERCACSRRYPSTRRR